MSEPFVYLHDPATDEWKSLTTPQDLSLLRKGFHRVRYHDGDTYEGEWLNGAKSGKGTYNCHQGWTYTGQWMNDEQHGKGTSNSDGEVYDGEFRLGQRNGFGKVVHADGSRFEGIFKDGYREGKGKLFNADGSKCEGVWRQGIPVFATITAHDGSKTEGKFRDGEKDGWWVSTDRDGSKYEQQWRNGERVSSRRPIAKRCELPSCDCDCCAALLPTCCVSALHPCLCFVCIHPVIYYTIKIWAAVVTEVMDEITDALFIMANWTVHRPSAMLLLITVIAGHLANPCLCICARMFHTWRSRWFSGQPPAWHGPVKALISFIAALIAIANAGAANNLLKWHYMVLGSDIPLRWVEFMVLRTPECWEKARMRRTIRSDELDFVLLDAVGGDAHMDGISTKGPHPDMRSNFADRLLHETRYHWITVVFQITESSIKMVALAMVGKGILDNRVNTMKFVMQLIGFALAIKGVFTACAKARRLDSFT